MTLRRSSGLDSSLVAGLVDSIQASSLSVFSGPQPVDANSVATGTLLYTINNGGSGLTWVIDPVLDVASKDPNQEWSGEVLASGVAGWFRVCVGDPINPLPGAVCIDGSIGTKNADVILRSVRVEQGTLQVVSQFELSVI